MKKFFLSAKPALHRECLGVSLHPVPLDEGLPANGQAHREDLLINAPHKDPQWTVE